MRDLIQNLHMSAKRRFSPYPRDGIPAINVFTVRALTDQDLLSLASEFGAHAEPGSICGFEVRRREGRTARLALAISFGSLLVSIIALGVGVR